ncbi:MerR family DNA-binding protein [bacterium]|nr:MerR family DNA-binding protein [bacterium]
MKTVDGITIGKLAKLAGVGVETIRFYERKGLLRKPPKRDSGFRHYPSEETARVRFIKRAQELGFTLREVKELLNVQSQRKITGAQVNSMATEKIAEIRKKISDLRQMEESLLALAKSCGGGAQAIRECRIFECFEKGC